MDSSTDQIFSSAIIVSSSEQQKAKLKQFSEYREKRYYANVWVQLLLFLNVHFCILWLISCIITLYYEYWSLSTIHRILSVFSIVVAAPIECLRLYLGYSGNLLDKIPDFAGFWILSVFIQTPLQIYLMSSEQTLKYKTSTTFQGIQCILLFLQIVSSFSAIRRASRYRREQFQKEKATIEMGHQIQTMGSKISVISD